MKLVYEEIRLNLKHTFKIARSSSDYRDALIIQLSDNKYIGWGEITPYTYYGQTLALAKDSLPLIETALASLEAPKSLAEINSIIEKIQEHLYGIKGYKKEFNHILSGLSSALTDLCCKITHTPLHNFVENEIFRVRFVGQRHFPYTSFTLGIDSPEKLKLKLQEAAEYKILKIKLGFGLKEDLESLRTLRSLTQTRLRVDANCGWSLENAITLSQFMQKENVEFIEQPFPPEQFTEYKILEANTTLPIILDESIVMNEDIERNKDYCSGVNIKLSKCGGIINASEMIKEARRLGLKVMLGGMIETGVGMGMAAALSHFSDFIDLDGNLLINNDPYTNLGNLRMERGQVKQFASEPGLGF